LWFFGCCCCFRFASVQHQNGRLDPSTTCYDSPTCYDVAYYFSRGFLFLFKNHFLWIIL
jgi:hypothetical protein